MNRRPCIVCLDDVEFHNSSSINIPILSTIYHNYKLHWQKCGCKIHAHTECIHYWYSRNPTCPYCKRNVVMITFYPMAISTLPFSVIERTLLDTTVATAHMIINSITLYICIEIFLNTIHYCN